MEINYYCIKQLFVGEDGFINEKLIKKTTNKKECKQFLKIVKKMKPKDQFLFYEQEEIISDYYVE